MHNPKKELMSDKHYSFFQAVEKSFDKAAKFTKWEKGILEQIKACKQFTACVFR